MEELKKTRRRALEGGGELVDLHQFMEERGIEEVDNKDYGRYQKRPVYKNGRPSERRLTDENNLARYLQLKHLAWKENLRS